MIPVLAPIYGIFLVRQYAVSIPDDLLNAARLDGASELRIFRSVVLPALAPVLATLGVFTFLSAWNDFMWPLIVLSDDARYTLPVALANLSGEHVQDVELMMSGAVVTVLPVFLAFLFLQRYYIQGIMAGSVKGGSPASSRAPSPRASASPHDRGATALERALSRPGYRRRGGFLRPGPLPAHPLDRRPDPRRRRLVSLRRRPRLGPVRVACPPAGAAPPEPLRGPAGL